MVAEILSQMVLPDGQFIVSVAYEKWRNLRLAQPDGILWRMDFQGTASRRSRLKNGSSSATQALERSACTAAADIRHDGQFEYGDTRKLDTVFLNFARCRGWAEIPLLAY